MSCPRGNRGELDGPHLDLPKNLFCCGLRVSLLSCTVTIVAELSSSFRGNTSGSQGSMAGDSILSTCWLTSTPGRS